MRMRNPRRCRGFSKGVKMNIRNRDDFLQREIERLKVENDQLREKIYNLQQINKELAKISITKTKELQKDLQNLHKQKLECQNMFAEIRNVSQQYSQSVSLMMKKIGLVK